MDVDFQTEKRKSSLGKRYRDQVDDKDDDRKAESDMEMDNFQTQNMDFNLGKLDNEECFRNLLAVPEKQRPTYGNVIVEVFRVIVNVPEGREGYLSGKIYLTDTSDYVYIYKQEGEGGQHIKEGCDLLTTGSGLPCYDYLFVFVDLLFSTSEHQRHTDCSIPDRDKLLTIKGHFDDKGDFYDDKGNLVKLWGMYYYDREKDDTEDELDEDNFIRISNCKGCFRKNGRFKESKFEGLHFYGSSNLELFDKALSYTVCSKDDTCSVTMFYTIFSKAVQATVEMVWLKDEPEFGIYGLIAARNDMIKEKDFEIILFLKEDLSQSVPVVSGQPIKLSRSVITVPIDSKLLVRVHLSTKDKPFPSARLLFPPQQSGISELTIDGTMQVTVTWQNQALD